MADLLEVEDVFIGYTQQPVVCGVGFTIEVGRTVALVGANGAGKTTIASAIAGLLRPSKGDIRFDGRSILRLSPMQRVGLGIALVPEGRCLFPQLSVHDNLLLGAWRRRGGWNERADEMLDMFPILRSRASQLAGTLSGGEQQMLAVARALMSAPKLLILDEPLLGLAPIPTRQILEKVRDLNALGVSVLLIEQNAIAALEVANRGIVLERGLKKLDDESSRIRSDPSVVAAYLGGVA